MAAQYTSIKKVLDSIMRHPLLQDITLETAVEYTIDFMRIVGAPSMFLEKTNIIKIHKYRGILPEDYYSILQIRDIKVEDVAPKISIINTQEAEV